MRKSNIFPGGDLGHSLHTPRQADVTGRGRACGGGARGGRHGAGPSATPGGPGPLWSWSPRPRPTRLSSDAGPLPATPAPPPSASPPHAPARAPGAASRSDHAGCVAPPCGWERPPSDWRCPCAAPSCLRGDPAPFATLNPLAAGSPHGQTGLGEHEPLPEPSAEPGGTRPRACGRTVGGAAPSRRRWRG